MMGAFIAYFFNTNYGVDPVLACVDRRAVRLFRRRGSCTGSTIYAFERHGEESLQGLAFFFGLLFIIEVGLLLIFGVDYRFVEAPYIGPSHRGRLHLGSLADAGPAARRPRCDRRRHLFNVKTFTGKAILAVSQDPGWRCGSSAAIRSRSRKSRSECRLRRR